MIEMEGVVKYYRQARGGVHALRGVDFSVADGEFVAVTGPSGSGKSTLLNILGCLDRPDGGEYRLAGRSVAHLRPAQLAEVRRKVIGFVFQSFHLLPRMTAQENVELPLMLSGIPLPFRRKRAGELLEKMGLGDRLHHLPGELSGGQRQRVAIARALVKGPEVIFADEPTGNLDETTGREIMEIFGGLHKEGCTVVLITHQPETARCAGKGYRMKNGRLERYF
ncbi:ABC transporter ATP-binding protein [Gehongia tenuis]|uniref:ABC transporter ATP-binding protein n=1 Tax=Gehongia tenuis TaxID=2763655 RepID=A0A926D1K9_9FIRM|nr:ABC transporter ATP-binding protein [Gehongia tenuis]MBC8530710.1 ABC transporter ATP-binding protein [Gehongia tenuis]